MDEWIGDRLKWISDSLSQSGIVEARLEAEYIAASALGVSRSALSVITAPAGQSGREDVSALMEAKVLRRRRREPLQHIFGSWDFYGLEFTVGPQVLVPRPETEGLVEIVLGWLKSRRQSSRSEQGVVGVDWGTGSGCIAITLAHHCPFLKITAIDISRDALVIASKNGARHNVLGRVGFVHGDGLSCLDQNFQFDFLVGNPPYIPGREIGNLEPEVRDYDPRAALDGGTDGLDPYRAIVKVLSTRRSLPSLIALEIGADQGPAVRDLFSVLPGRRPEIRQDLLKRDRYLFMETD